MRTERVEKVISFLESTGRNDKIRLINESPLTDKECRILILRYVNGLSIKESSDNIGISPEAFSKAQRKAIERFYSYNFPQKE